MNKDKTTYSQSRLTHYTKCPKMFALSREHRAVFGTSTQSVMRDGQLFEGYVFGFKDDKDEKELIGRKKEKTLQGIKAHADHVKPIFSGGDSYLYISADMNGYTLRGEADYLGKINCEAYQQLFNSPCPEYAFIDLKYTGDIPRVWDRKVHKEDYLQAIMYTYIHYLNTGKILPFIYVIVENKYDVPVCRAVHIEPSGQDFEWLQGFIDKVDSDLFFDAQPSPEVCLGSRGDGRCWFLEHCTEGRKLAGGAKVIDFNSLISKMDLI